MKLPKPSPAVGTNITKRRAALVPVLSRVDLGKLVSKTPAQMAEIESGKVLPDPTTRSMLEKILEIKLTEPGLGDYKPNNATKAAEKTAAKKKAAEKTAEKKK